MNPRKAKPHRVSYYFPKTADAGKVRLYTRPVMALTTDAARAEVERIFATAGVVTHKAYHCYRPYKHARKATYIPLPLQPQSFTSSTVQSFPSTVTMTTPGPVSSGTGVAFAKLGTSDKFVPLGRVTSFSIKSVETESWNGHRFSRLRRASHAVCDRCNLSDVYAKADNIACPNAPRFVPDFVKNAQPQEVFPGLENTGYTPPTDEPGLEPQTTGSVPEPDYRDAVKVEVGCDDPNCEICGENQVGAAADGAIKITEPELNPFEFKDDGAELPVSKETPSIFWVGLVISGLLLVGYLLLKGFHIIH